MKKLNIEKLAPLLTAAGFTYEGIEEPGTMLLPNGLGEVAEDRHSVLLRPIKKMAWEEIQNNEKLDAIQEFLGMLGYEVTIDIWWS